MHHGQISKPIADGLIALRQRIEQAIQGVRTLCGIAEGRIVDYAGRLEPSSYTLRW